MNPEALTPAKTKMRRLIGRAKSAKKPPTSATKAQAPAVTDLQETPQAPAEQIGALVEPVRAGGKAKAKMSKPAPLSVRLDREPGRGWFHIVIDGERVGAVFKTTRKGVAFWAAETPDRALRAEGANSKAAVDGFVTIYTSRIA